MDMRAGAPFRRAHLMMAAIAAVMAATVNNPVLQRAQLAEIGPYESRGKGQGRFNRKARGGEARNRRAAVKARNVKRFRKACRG